ncbi:hypothetical protein EKO27_g53 [Xylaria grammica]|uniref:Helicase ATP-binding domain-containing protein n=1 Tax=Xylaria grammica TaxID=363999 RepID=A0A439DKR5_9PEZI|nr:hypothetical protein EKO27_g53 [Xylaria grammica]
MAERPHRHAKIIKPSVLLSRKINTELFEHPDGNRVGIGLVKPEKKGRWDPYDRFNTKEELTRFYSGHDYRQHILMDRENFAKFCIQKTLDGHTDDNFETTGEIMKNESLVKPSDEPGLLDNLASTIKAEVQQDVDCEIPRDSFARTSKADDNGSTQNIIAAAQSIIAASPNSLGPPINPCVAYLQMTKCGQYSRGNSALWKSPFIPRLDNECGRRGLLDHQVTGIVWLLSRMFGDLPTLEFRDPSTSTYYLSVGTSSDAKLLKGPKYFGGILADSMGLGKTLITVALVNLLISQGLNTIEDEDGTTKHRPMLLLAPNPTVANQWVEEFIQVIDEHTLPQIIVSGNGLETPGNQVRVTHLARDSFKQWPACINYIWDENDRRASKAILIMTMESWAQRTCVYDEEGEWISTFTREGRRFSLVMVDEAYKVKNPKTKNWRSVFLLERQFTLLITATPCMNTLTDMFGLARLLWTEPEKYLKRDPKVWDEVEETFQDLGDLCLLDNLDPWHDHQLVAGRPALLARLLYKPRNSKMHDINLTRKYLRYFETLAMLKRSPSSYIYADWGMASPISLEGLFPKVEDYTVDIGGGKSHDKQYQSVHVDLLIQYLNGLKDWGGATKRQSKKKPPKEVEDAKEDIMNCHRLFQIASSSLDVHKLDMIITANGHSTLAEKVTEMREKEVNLLRLAQFLALPTEKRPDTHVGWMALATRNSPILRYILLYINENILTREENGRIKKLLIIEQNLMVAFYYELVLQFLGFECRCLHAQLSSEERQKLVDSFNSGDDESCQILIQLYTVGFAGTNLHKSCSRVLVAAQSYSLQIQWQAIYRVIRVGQNSDVTVHRLKLKNSYHSFRESRQIEKILPELGARAQGKTKQVLVRLLNLFKYEIYEAWNSPEGQKLLREKNLLEGDEVAEKENSTAKRHKPDFPVIPTKSEIAKKEEEEWTLERPVNPLASLGKKYFKIKSEAKDEGRKFSDVKEADSSGHPLVSNPGTSSKKRKLDDFEPRDSNRGRGWYNSDESLSDDMAFLALRTRNDYYQEFLDLPHPAKRVFSHAKNNLRRLLSYGNDEGKLSTEPWVEADLENPAVLERALELMLRVRLGAKDIAMLPFPTIDLSAAPASRRAHLRRLLSQAQHTDQDLDAARPVASKDPRETLRGSDLNRPLVEIEDDLEVRARFGDANSGSAKKKKKKGEEEEPTASTIIDLTDYANDAHTSFNGEKWAGTDPGGARTVIDSTGFTDDDYDYDISIGDGDGHES